MSIFYGFADELVKIATEDEAIGEYTTPMAALGLSGAVAGALTGSKGKRLQDALIMGLIGTGVGAGKEYWSRRKARKAK